LEALINHVAVIITEMCGFASRVQDAEAEIMTAEPFAAQIDRMPYDKRRTALSGGRGRPKQFPMKRIHSFTTHYSGASGPGDVG
jgi:hypothetical protein